MPTLRLLADFIKKYKHGKSTLYLLCFVMLFWSLYEGVISYMTPLIISERGISETLMGIIIGSSSIAGALFDFIACRIFKNTYYKRMFLIMFAICLFYPLILFKANTFILYIIAMAIWGVYFDLKNIGNFDFVGRQLKKSEHSEGFGLIQVFQSIGFLIAPILVGFMIAEAFDYKPLVLAWIFLIIAIFFFLIMYYFSPNRRQTENAAPNIKEKGLWLELKTWKKIGRILLPVLILTLMLNFIDAFFWTVGPIFAEGMSEIRKFSGFFMTAYSLPALLVGWLVGSLTRRYGKKRTAFVSLGIGSILLFLIYFLNNPIFIILTIFISSIFISISWPAINGAYADYISESPDYEKEIESLEDFFTNLGYVLGPMIAGFVADRFGNSGAFSFIGLSGSLVAILLIIITPKKINIKRDLIT